MGMTPDVDRAHAVGEDAMGTALDTEGRDSTQVQTVERLPAPLPRADAYGTGLAGMPTVTGALRAAPATLAVRYEQVNWLRIVISALKGLILVNVLGITVFLAAYSGVAHILPATPPALRVAGTAGVTVAERGSYCWAPPGHGVCQVVDLSAAAPRSLPQATVAPGVLALTFAYPGPTSCTATATDTAHAGQPPRTLAPLTGSAAQWWLAPTDYRLPISLAAGTYRVDLACVWAPPQTQRWLKGQGTAAYSLVLHVVGR
jgi:hypothetical protein